MSDTFDEYADRLMAYDDATNRAFRAVVSGDRNDALAADTDVALTSEAVAAFEMDRANEWLMGMRLAVKWYPATVLGFFDQVEELRAECERQFRRRVLAER